ncbi:MAG TPA: ATP synthase F1 subunit delta [Terriglobales bacterium]|nr:ATP synthase F1 subunit delta [Terriglobales bacterium]
MTGSVARRYARALFELSRERNTLEDTAAEIDRLAGIAADPKISAVLANPMLPPSRRSQIAQLIIKDISPSDLTARFVALLADQQRLGELPGIARELSRLLDRHLGRVRLIVRAPMALSSEQGGEIVSTFAKLTGKSVLPTFEVDADLLGGVVVEAEGKVYDGSIKTQLERLAKQLSGAVH